MQYLYSDNGFFCKVISNYLEILPKEHILKRLNCIKLFWKLVNKNNKILVIKMIS